MVADNAAGVFSDEGNLRANLVIYMPVVSL